MIDGGGALGVFMLLLRLTAGGRGAETPIRFLENHMADRKPADLPVELPSLPTLRPRYAVPTSYDSCSTGSLELPATSIDFVRELLRNKTRMRSCSRTDVPIEIESERDVV